MVIGACRVTLHLPDNRSLKGKRQVVRSITERVKHRFNVSISEIEDQDLWQVAAIGFTCVSAHSRHADEMVAKIMGFIEANVDAQVTDYQVELIHAF